MRVVFWGFVVLFEFFQDMCVLGQNGAMSIFAL